MTDKQTTEFIDEPDVIRNEAIDNGLLMTDNRTTEKLRKLLDERGVEWWETISSVNYILTWWESPTFGMVHAMDNEDGETLFMACLNDCNLTPEQAIAATLGEQIVRCRDCKHATISTTGVCKYCEMFVLPDTDGYGADPQVNLPLDFFCGFAECKEVEE